ncbi:unnamed protein product [Clonostachys rhizophaga]|uniref:Zn(2)-C6 fungal-type domain-containing protein n=1 Tax=Clonostachys rhizophaga TaxID=160324 RepID=A0A9N9YJ88_9HYPO|nr:unnamed protein product [Clonostachys rhizophaga]
MSQGSISPTRNRKTFSGCWSCRERKIKCDEAKPTCRQCMKSHLECKGYGLRLQWIINKQPDAEFPGVSNPRRNIALDAHTPVLSLDRIDEILTSLGHYDPRHRPALQENIHIFTKCFGVFRDVKSEVDASPLTIEFTPTSTEAQHTLNTASTTTSPVIGENASIDVFDHNFSTPKDDRGSLMNRSSNQSPSISRFGIDTHNQSKLNARGGFAEEIETGSFGLYENGVDLASRSVTLGRTEKFLIHYYSKRVVNLFCVIENGTSPWKSIHLPKILHAVGEITIEGETSRICEALVRSCLSISAFCLSNDCGLRLQETKALRWEQLANEFRLQAIRLLRNAMQNDFYPNNGVKYTDFLATTLSMITIDVMSGKTDTCGIHLDGALRLINHGQTWKQQYSSKAETLHRMYFYLRAIFESTLPRHSRSRRLRTSCSTEEDVDSQDVFCHKIVAKSSACPEHLTEEQKTDPKIGSFESIYGVPYSLLFLLTKVIDLIYKLYDESFDGRIPLHLMDECDELEYSIMDWPAHTSFPYEPPHDYSSSAKIVHYHTAAFHEALIIYFAQHVRLVGHRFLQPHIRAVLGRMEVIEQIKVETNLVAAPLYWPAFIAGSEAFDEALQKRFRKWYEHVMFYGIEALRTGFSVLEEVWEMGPQRADRVTSSWREVVEKSSKVLMLS